MTSKIKVDNITNQSDSNIVNKCGTTITLGASGDTVNLASGASQTGFGRTGTVDWQTGDIKTATFTAANGEGYFANTSGGAFTMNLPAGTAGNIVSVVDYTNTFQTNSLTIAANGSQKIGGVAASNTLSTEGQSVTFVYVDDTEGWKNVQDSTSNVTGNPFLIATGGTITTSGNCKIHTFTGPGTFTVSKLATCSANDVVGYLAVAGGGGGGNQHGGGGGAGGFREGRTCSVTPYTVSPLAVATGITVTATSFPITVGSGGGGTNQSGNFQGASGGTSTFSTITSAGGGGGHSYYPGNKANGVAGGSGGGATGVDGSPGTATGGTGNTPPVSPSQGSNGGPANTGGSSPGGAGGGGATENAGSPVGSSVPSSPGQPATQLKGGAGATTHITGSPVGYAGGGGGGKYTSPAGGPASDGGGAGGPNPEGSPTSAGVNGTANRGGGGGGASDATGAANGGSGIVVIRYKFQ